jgi:subtilisin family serine protease
MHFRKLLIITAMLSAMSATSAGAAQPTSDKTFPVIVQLSPTLATIDPDLSDTRINNRTGFGNLRPEVLAHIQRLEKAHGFKAKHGFSRVIKGFSANLTTDQITQLRYNPEVRMVEMDVEMHATAQTLPWGISSTGASTSPAALSGDGLNNGVSLSQVRAIVADSGVALHPDLNLATQVNYMDDGIAGDCNGHGTHVAGTIGARDNADAVVGMAPGIQILPVKVLDCAGKGTASSLIKAFDYAASTAAANPSIKYVFNASIGFPPGTTIAALDTAVQNAVVAGVFVSVAMGNDGAANCTNTMVNLSQGQGATGVVAVGAIDSASQEASWSNYGPCVGVWAPGVSVYSTSSSLGVAVMSGTSMATPHVTGAAALIRATDPSLTPAQVDARIKAMAPALGTVSKDGRAIVGLNVASVAPRLTSVAQVTPAILDFGTVKFGKAAAVQTITVRNGGNQVMNLTGFTALPTGVSLSGHNCTGVAAGLSCTAKFTLGTSRKSVISATVATQGATTNGTFTMRGQVK